MVATLIKLKWRLTLNALTKNVWAIVGTVLGVLYGLGALAMVLAGAVGLGLSADPRVAALVLGSLGALLVVGWALVPLLVTGVDSTLDPRAMAAWTAPSRGLAAGLLAAGILGIPGCLTAVVCLVPVLTWLVAGQILAALLALLCAPAALATCVIVSRIVVTAAGISSSRRGRETTAIIAFLTFLAATQLPNLLPRLIGDDIAGSLERLQAVARALGLTPFGWAFAAPGLMATGSVLPALALTVGSWILPVALLPLWQRVVGRVMTSPGTSQTRTRAYSSHSADGHCDPQAEDQIDVLPWARRLGSLIPRPAVCATGAPIPGIWSSSWPSCSCRWSSSWFPLSTPVDSSSPSTGIGWRPASPSATPRPCCCSWRPLWPCSWAGRSMTTWVWTPPRCGVISAPGSVERTTAWDGLSERLCGRSPCCSPSRRS